MARAGVQILLNIRSGVRLRLLVGAAPYPTLKFILSHPRCFSRWHPPVLFPLREFRRAERLRARRRDG